MTFRKGDPTPGRQVRGVGGNPGGRRAIVEVATAAREYTLEAIETLPADRKEPKATDRPRIMRQLSLLDRAWGKAPQTIDLQSHDDVKDLSDEDLLLIIGNCSRARQRRSSC